MTENDRDNDLNLNGVSLREYLCAKIIALNTKIDLHLQLNKVALDKAESQLDERLAGVNDRLVSLKDQQDKFVSKSEWSGQLQRMLEDVQSLRESRSRLEGKASAASVYVAYGISLVGIVVSIVLTLMKN